MGSRDIVSPSDPTLLSEFWGCSVVHYGQRDESDFKRADPTSSMGRQRHLTPKAAEAKARVRAKNQTRRAPLKRSTDSGAITSGTATTGAATKAKAKIQTATRIIGEDSTMLSTYEKKIAENVAWNKSLLESLGLGGGNPLGIPEIVTRKESKAPNSEDYVLMIPELEQDRVHMDGYNDYNDKSDSNSNSDNDQGYDRDDNDGNTDLRGHGSNDMYTQENEGNIVEISSSACGPLAHKAQVSRGLASHSDHADDGNSGTSVARAVLPSLSHQLLRKSTSSLLK
ncbi:hypothetical protein BS47DRAFT_1370018 [Hydnum rufescens UP504]|uniref:Uncharacterized protein n=1 Tax=Hydnum rufescens UP504 TaxID=1448309 RepID=A0A9P6AAP6_9AGAM|nr:hypothetical protein BS47DRAFT_1370018 [Hydnum rufescens UP504]